MGAPLILRTDVGDEPLDILEFEARVRRREITADSWVRFPAVTGKRFVLARELSIFATLQEPEPTYLRRALGLPKFPWLTLALIAVNLAVFLFTSLRGPLDLDAMVRFGGKVYPLVLDLGEVWRILSANFLHRDSLHLALNMFVFLNVGVALENIYRRSTYCLLLLVSGTAAWVVSLIVSDAVSVGASGIIYGGLGALASFGFRYRSVLPSRYRRLLGEAAIPTIAVFLWLGWTSPGTDNAAHLGGLLSGIALSALLKPRLFGGATAVPHRAIRGAVAGAIVGLIFLTVSIVAPQVFPICRPVREDQLGVSVLIPVSWKRGLDESGNIAFYNGLPGYGLARFQISRREAEISEVIEETMADLGTANPETRGPARIVEKNIRTSLDGHEARKLEAEINHPSGKRRLIAFFVARGQFVYEFLFTIPQAYPAYRRLVSYMSAKITMDEPAPLREARARLLLFPGVPWQMGLLGNLLRQYGEAREGAELLAQAVRNLPSSVALRAQLALALLESGDTDRGCRAASDAAAYGPTDSQALEVSARCELARGNAAQALKYVTLARAYNPDDAHLKLVELRLRNELQRLSNSP